MYNTKVATIYNDDKKITIWSLAFPLLIQMLLSNLINTTGVTVLAGYSAAFVTATSISSQILIIPRTVLDSIITGTVILSSVSLGKKDKNDAASICGCGLISIFALSIIVGGIMGIFPEQFVAMMNLKDNTASITAEYLRWYAPIGLPIEIMVAAFQKLHICNGNSKIIPFSSITTALFNVGLSYLVLYVVKLPVSDITALAFKTCFAWSIGLLIVVIAFVKIKCPLKLAFNFKIAYKIAKIGLPAGMCLISYNFSNTITTSFLGDLGETTINTKVFINNIVGYVPLIIYAIAQANAIIMGRHRGAGRFADMKILFRQNILLGVTVNGTLSIICFIFQKPLLSIFTSDTQILKLATIIMLLDIPLEIFRSINHFSQNSLNPNGDIKATLIISVVGAWTFSVLLGYILCVVAGLGLVGLWIGFASNEAFNAIMSLFRWRSNKWQKTRI